MYLESRQRFFNPPPFNLATNTVLGSTQRWPIDRTYPIEEIQITVNFDVTTGFTTTNSTTPDMYDNILSILQRVTLTINDGRQPRNVIDCSGVALIEYAMQHSLNIDDATQYAMMVSNNPVGALAVPVGRYQITYRIPMVSPLIAEPLRTRCYLPVHTHPQDPVLTLQFNTVAGMSATGTGAIGTVVVEVLLLNRLPTKESEALLRSTPGSNPTGYLDFDLIETPTSFPLGTANEQRIALPIPGNYTGLLFRQYKGGAAPLTRNSTVDFDVGDTIANNLGLETRWRLETGLVVLREWRWKHIRNLNDATRCTNRQLLSPLTPFVAASSAGAVTSALGVSPVNSPGGLQGTTSYFRAPTSVYMDFLGDGVSGENNNELGSCLDCNTPANNGLKMEVIGKIASVATNASWLYILGHRFFGDISRWQKF